MSSVHTRSSAPYLLYSRTLAAHHHDLSRVCLPTRSAWPPTELAAARLVRIGTSVRPGPYATSTARAVTADRVCLRASMTERPTHMSSARAAPVHRPPDETTTDRTYHTLRGVIWRVRPAQGIGCRRRATARAFIRRRGRPAFRRAIHACTCAYVHVGGRLPTHARTHARNADRQVDPFGQDPGSHATCWAVLVHTDCKAILGGKFM